MERNDAKEMMQIFIFYFEYDWKTYSINLKTKGWNQAEILAMMLGYELKGVLKETILKNEI